MTATSTESSLQTSREKTETISKRWGFSMASDKEMIEEYLSKNKATEIESVNDEESDAFSLKTKAHRTSADYVPKPMWHELVVIDNETGKEIEFKKDFFKASKRFTYKEKYAVAATWYYIPTEGQRVRESTISEKIASGRYKIIEKPRY